MSKRKADHNASEPKSEKEVGTHNNGSDKADHNASKPKSEKEVGTHNNGSDGDGIKKDDGSGDAKDVDKNFDFCAYYYRWDIGDDDAIGATGNDDFIVDYEKGQQGLARYICSSGLPDIVRLVRNLNGSFPLDSSTIRRNCLQVYEKEKLRVKHILETMDGQISLSVELLRFYRRITGNDSEFMCLAAHFVDDRWKQKRWVLGFRLINGPSGEILHTAALKTLKDWDIESKVSSLTLAESNLYDEMVEEFKDGVQQKKKLPLDGKLFRVQCCAEMFNQMADAAYKEISDIINKVSLLISWNFAPVWYLPAYKLKEALEMDAMGEFSPEKVSDFFDIPSADEWEKVKCICKLVSSAEAVAKSIFRKKQNPTANVFLHHLEELRVILFKETIGSDSFTGKVAKKMLRILDKYLEDMFTLLSIASAMDPRQKMTYVDYLSSKSEASDTKSRSTSLLDALYGIYSGYADHDLEKEKSEGDSTSSDSDDSEEELISSPEGGGSRNLNWLEEYNQFIESNTKPPKSDLDRYLEEPVLPWTTDFNVLKWWRAESPKYPILSKMARDILAIPMSVPDSNYAFHTEEREVETRMVVCGPALWNALMCTRTWDMGC